MPSIMAIVGANISQFEQQMDAAQRHAKEVGTGIGEHFGGIFEKLSSGKGIVSMFAAYAAASIKNAAEYAGHIEDAYQETDIAREKLQAWDLVMKQNGQTLDTAIAFFDKLGVARRKALAGDEKAMGGFTEFGISKNVLSDMDTFRIEDVADMIGRAYEKGDPQKLNAVFKDLGIKNGRAMVAAFRSDFAATMDQALSGGYTMTPTAVRELDAVGDFFTRLKAMHRSFWGDLAGETVGRAKDFWGVVTGSLSFRDAMLNRGSRVRDKKGGFGAIDDEDTAAERLTTEQRLARERDALIAQQDRRKAGIPDKETAEQKKEREDRDKEIERIRKSIEATEKINRMKREGLSAPDRLGFLRLDESSLQMEARVNPDQLARVKAQQDLLKVQDEIRKVQKEIAGDAQKAQKIDEQTAEIKRNAIFKNLTATEQERMLVREIGELKKKRAEDDLSDPEKRALADKKIAEREAELTTLQHKRDKIAIPTGATIEGGGFLGGYGAYMTAPEQAMLDTQKKSLEQLMVIATHVERMASAKPEGVTF